MRVYTLDAVSFVNFTVEGEEIERFHIDQNSTVFVS